MTDGFIKYWEHAVTQKDSPEHVFAQKMVGLPKVVFSKTLTHVEGKNVRVKTGTWPTPQPLHEPRGDWRRDPHVVKTPGVCGGGARIERTRVRVYNVAFLHKDGASDAKIREAYPDLTLAQVHAALAY